MTNPIPSRVICPHCGISQLESSLVGGLCASCLAGSMKLDLGSPEELGLEEKEPQSIQIHGYEVLELVGGGGMGEVYRATVAGDEQVVALKVVAGRLTRDPEVTARFEAEIAAMAQLDHPNVVRVLDYGETANGRHFLVMEYVDGCDLRRLLRTERLGTERAFDLFLKVCAGVGHAHERGLAHRDIKPANILIGQDGTVKVADFGLAKTLVDTAGAYHFTQTRDTFGTPYYIAPEVTRRASAADARSDVYALGVLLYELLSGTVPMGQFTPLSQITGLDRSIDALVSQALADDPTRRLATVAGFVAAVEKIAAEHCLRPVKQKRRVRWLAAAGMIAILGIGVGAGVWWSAGRGDPRPVFRGASTATKDQPWSNSIGMKFVPVPETTVLFSIHETRLRDFEAYFKADNARPEEWRAGEKDRLKPMGKGRKPSKVAPYGESPTWRSPGMGFVQTAEHPVCGIDLQEARMFCAWINWKEHAEGRLTEGQRYRLPTDEEWSHAALLEQDADLPAPFKAESHDGDPDGEANFAGLEAPEVPPWPAGMGSLRRRDPFPRTAPVGSFKPNALGLYDLSGNLAEWTDESDLQLISRLRTSIIRGGSWASATPRACRLEMRQSDRISRAKPTCGFRIVLDLQAAAATPSKIDEAGFEGADE